MIELNTIICDTSYDEELLEIENFKLHEELLPFIGSNYGKFKLLLVGESHYIKEDGLSNQELRTMYENWYDEPTEANRNATKYKEWFTTRNIIKCFQCHYRSRAYTMFSNPGKVMKEILGENCPTDSAAFSLVSFFNYFQRPNLKEGKTLNPIYPDEEKITAEIFEQIIDIIKPDRIIFLSTAAYRSYMSHKNIDCPIVIDFTSHPTSPWWNRDNGSKGKQKFTEIVQDFFPDNTLKEKLPDERIWLMRNLFEDIKNLAENKGYSYKYCSNDYIKEFYEKGRNPSKLPYLIISNGIEKVKIEIDSRIYIWKNKKDWEYLSLNNKKTNTEKRAVTPSFRSPNKVYMDLFDNEFRHNFAELSLDYIAELIN